MKTRDHYFKRESSIGLADILIIPIKIKAPISYISIEFQATNGATSCVNTELHDYVSAIEIVDGSDVLWSLAMPEAKALNFYETKQWAAEVLSEEHDKAQEERCVLHFGRYPDDDEYYLQPQNYDNLQLRITYALPAAAGTTFVADSQAVTIMARIIEEGARAYKGFLSAKQKISFTGSATAGDREIEMPRDMPYRLMMLKSLLTLKTHAEGISKYKLSCDADRYVPFNMYTEDIRDMNKQRFGLCRQKKELFGKDTSTHLFDIYNIEDGRVWSETTLTLAVIDAITAERISLAGYTLSASAYVVVIGSEVPMHAVVEGTEPYGCLCIPFGDMNEPGDWFRAGDYGDIRLTMTEVVTNTPACAIILQQLRV